MSFSEILQDIGGRQDWIDSVRQQIRQSRDFRAGSDQEPASARRVTRLGWRLKPLSLLHWLDANPGPVPLYWSNRGGDFALAGLGVCEQFFPPLLDERQKWHRPPVLICPGAPDLPAGRFVGGVRFDIRRGFNPGSPGDHNPGPLPGVAGFWEEFDRGLFTIPRLEIFREGPDGSPDNRYFFLINIPPGETGAGLNGPDLVEWARRYWDFLEKMSWPGPFENEAVFPGKILKWENKPDRSGWDQMLREISGEITAGRFQKIVAARQTRLELSEHLSLPRLLWSLKKKNPPAYRFLLGRPNGARFFGASPERLFREEDSRRIFTEAVAGTRLAGGSEPLYSELIKQAARAQKQRPLRELIPVKDRREHELVKDYLETALKDAGPLSATGLDTEDMETLPLWGLEHLLTKIRAEFRQPVPLGKLLGRLHPTPAVAGFPDAAASLEWLRSREEFDRGWFCGAVGWFGPESSEFCVAIRSGLLMERDLYLYSGAGIVADSDPEMEWREIEGKIRIVLESIEGKI